MKLLFKIAYCGKAFCGYQVQPNGRTVQKTLQDATEQLFGARYPLTGCSRTDSGVHANAFFCTLDAGVDATKIPLRALPVALNRYLPSDISLLDAYHVPDDFHPRYDVETKEYVYRILDRGARCPFREGLVYHYPYPLDVEKMENAVQGFIGTHDFIGFMASGSDVKDTVRTITQASVCRTDDEVHISLRADGFLYNMVRIITGTLIEVSRGSIAPDQIGQIIASRDRSCAGATAPAQGLYLNDVTYRHGAWEKVTK